MQPDDERRDMRAGLTGLLAGILAEAERMRRAVPPPTVPVGPEDEEYFRAVAEVADHVTNLVTRALDELLRD
jgi:hypothetical protein